MSISFCSIFHQWIHQIWLFSLPITHSNPFTNFLKTISLLNHTPLLLIILFLWPTEFLWLPSLTWVEVIYWSKGNTSVTTPLKKMTSSSPAPINCPLSLSEEWDSWVLLCMEDCWWTQSCAGLVQLARDTVRSWVQWSFHGPGMLSWAFFLNQEFLCSVYFLLCAVHWDSQVVILSFLFRPNHKHECLEGDLQHSHSNLIHFRGRT